MEMKGIRPQRSESPTDVSVKPLERTRFALAHLNQTSCGWEGYLRGETTQDMSTMIVVSF